MSTSTATSATSGTSILGTSPNRRRTLTPPAHPPRRAAAAQELGRPGTAEPVRPGGRPRDRNPVVHRGHQGRQVLMRQEREVPSQHDDDVGCAGTELSGIRPSGEGGQPGGDPGNGPPARRLLQDDAGAARAPPRRYRRRRPANRRRHRAPARRWVGRPRRGPACADPSGRRRRRSGRSQQLGARMAARSESGTLDVWVVSLSGPRSPSSTCRPTARGSARAPTPSPSRSRSSCGSTASRSP